VTIAAPLSSIPDRLEGWGLAAGVGTCAVMLLWPPRARDVFRAQAARACLALADLADAKLAGDQTAIEARALAAGEAVRGLRSGFLGAPHRPTGPTGPTAALAALVDELDWLQSFLARGVEGSLELCREENAEALAATVAVLRASAATLDSVTRPAAAARRSPSRRTLTVIGSLARSASARLSSRCMTVLSNPAREARPYSPLMAQG